MNNSPGQYRALIRRLESVRELDAQAMADTLLDVLGADLRDLDLGLGKLGQLPNLGPDSRAVIDSMVQSAGRVRETLRGITHSLVPPGTEDLGLVPALERTLDAYAANAGVVAGLTVTGSVPTLSRDSRLLLHRVLEEALINVARHAGARRVDVQLAAEGPRIVLRVRDDGIGLTEYDRLKPGALGLFALQERLADCGGSLKLAGVTPRGTLLEVSLPATRAAGRASQMPDVVPAPVESPALRPRSRKIGR